MMNTNVAVNRNRTALLKSSGTRLPSSLKPQASSLLLLSCCLLLAAPAALADPPVITSVSPAGVGPAMVDDFSVTVWGSDLWIGSSGSGTTLALRRDGCPDITSAYPTKGGTLADGWLIFHDLDGSSSPAGRWDVVITRSDAESATLPDAFEIAAGPDVQARVIGTWGGSVETVFIDEAVDPYLAYVGSGRNLVVLDVTDPANVTELGRIDLGNLVLDVKVRDGYAYVGTYGEPSNFCTVNVSDPASMYVAWTSDEYGPASEVELYGELAWVLTHSDLRRFNITDPENLIWGGVAIWSIPETFTINGDLRYVGADNLSGWPKLYVYDLGPDPVFPTLLGEGELTWAPEGFDPTAIRVEGDYAYMTLQDPFLAVWDISNPAAPAHVGEYDDFVGGGGPLYTTPGFVYMADNLVNSTKTLKVLDIATDPTAPALVGVPLQSHGGLRVRSVVGPRAYAAGDEGLVVLDVSAPASPARVGAWASPGGLRQMAKVGDLLYVTDGVIGFTVLDVSDPFQPAITGSYRTSEASGVWGENWGIAVRDDLAYIAAGGSGLEIVDVADPALPAMVGSFPFESGLSATALELDGDIARVGVKAAVGGYLVNFDISDPANIVDVGFVSLGAAPNVIATRPDGVAHTAGGVLLGGGGGGVYAVDTSAVESPFVLSDVELADLDAPKDVAIQGDLRFVTNRKTDGTGGLYIQDVSDPSQPQTVGFLENYAASCVAVRDDVAYLVCTWIPNGAKRSLVALDISDPTAPVALNYATVPGAWSILVDPPYAYLTGGSGSGGSVGLVIVYIGVPGDADADLDLDLHDFAALQQCFGAGVDGSGVAFTADCLFADFDTDDDCDLDDFAAFAGQLTGPDPAPLDPTGACCLPDGTCSGGLTEPECTWYCGGVYQGDGTTCDTVTCPPTGACCLPYGSVVCQDWTEAACLDHGGTYYGDGSDCSEGWCPFGACCDPYDGTCTEKTPAACTATGGVYQGDGTDCATTTCPYGAYSNEIDPMTSAALAGTGLSIADDLTLEGTGARDLTYLDLRVYGNGGGAFDVTVELWTDCPGEVGASVIPGTTFNWTAVPDDGYVYTLTADLSAAPVTVPDTVWMAATFTTPESGWIIAEQAEIGTTQDLYARYNGAAWTCTATFTTHYAGLWANLQCIEGDGKSGGRSDGSPALHMEPVETPAVIEALEVSHER